MLYLVYKICRRVFCQVTSGRNGQIPIAHRRSGKRLSDR
ncbi:hypothetical protein SUS17_1777 [Sphingomonas sp. S17]|nr:hypothetical protein SUS17_1777 [Sphingomonas sp. S17]